MRDQGFPAAAALLMAAMLGACARDGAAPPPAIAGARAGASAGGAVHEDGRLRLITPRTLPAFRADFDAATDRLRYIAVFSPT